MNAPKSGFLARRRTTLMLAGAAGVAATAGALLARRHRETDRERPGPPAALLLAQTLADARGEPVDLGRYAGRPWVVNFWATWCPPCIEEMPELSAMQTEYSALGVQITGIGIDSAANIAGFAAKTPMQYPLLVAGPAGIAWMRELGNPQGGLPFTVVFGARGQLLTRILGRFSTPALRAVIESAASGQTS